jgi:tetratricopeptide (TPR) repeat protein
MAESKNQNPSAGKQAKAPASPSGGGETPPEWLGTLKELLDRLDPKDGEKALENMGAFVDGDMTWAQVQGIPQQMLVEIAERGYLKFKSGRFKEAEDLFKGLVLMDHRTAYYHTALGAIYQKQSNFFDALAEYTVALELDAQDITAYVNRGEVYYLMGLDEQPLKDLEEAIKLDPNKKDPWANRARVLKKQILEEMNAS